MSIFNDDQIRQAIENFQKTHPVSYTYDISHFASEDNVDAIKNVIDSYIERVQKDSEMHIIFEMAKQYMNGARPTFDKYTLKPVTMTLDCGLHKQRVIHAMLDERTHIIYAQHITKELAIEIGWKIKEVDHDSKRT